MHVEERHHAERHVGVAEGVRPGDGAGGGGQVPVPERDALGAPRAAARVEHQRHVVRRGRPGRAPARPPPDLDLARRAEGGGEDRDPPAGCPPRLLGAVGRDDEEPRVRVGQVEAELLETVAGVERRRRSDHSRRQEADHQGQPVREHDRDPVLPSDPGGRKRVGRRGDLRAEGAVADAEPGLRQYHRGAGGGSGGEQVRQGAGRSRLAHRDGVSDEGRD